MAFWSDASTEPLRQFRWVVNFGGNDETNLDKISYALKKVSRPKAKISEITHKYLNHSFYYPGRVEWEAVNMTFAAVPFDSSSTAVGTAQTLLSILASAGYVIPDRSALAGKNISTLGKSSFKDAVGEMHIRSIDPNGLVTEGFILKNPFFTSVEFGELDYGSDEIIDITCTVRYDFAFFSIDGTNPVDGTPQLAPITG